MPDGWKSEPMVPPYKCALTNANTGGPFYHTDLTYVDEGTGHEHFIILSALALRAIASAPGSPFVVMAPHEKAALEAQALAPHDHRRPMPAAGSQGDPQRDVMAAARLVAVEVKPLIEDVRQQLLKEIRKDRENARERERYRQRKEGAA